MSKRKRVYLVTVSDDTYSFVSERLAKEFLCEKLVDEIETRHEGGDEPFIQPGTNYTIREPYRNELKWLENYARLFEFDWSLQSVDLLEELPQKRRKIDPVCKKCLQEVHLAIECKDCCFGFCEDHIDNHRPCCK